MEHIAEILLRSADSKAAPSFPAEAPTAWLKIVEIKIQGSVAIGIRSSEEMDSKIRFVPLFPSSWNIW